MTASLRDLRGAMRGAQKRRRRAFRDLGSIDTPQADTTIAYACHDAAEAVNAYFNARAMAEYRRGLKRTAAKARTAHPAATGDGEDGGE